MPDTLSRDELAAIIDDLDVIAGNGATDNNPRLGLDYGTAEEWADAILARTGPLAHIDALTAAVEWYYDHNPNVGTVADDRAAVLAILGEPHDA